MRKELGLRSKEKDEYKNRLDVIEKRICELDVPDADISGAKAVQWMAVTNDCNAVDKDIIGCISKVDGLKETTDKKS